MRTFSLLTVAAASLALFSPARAAVSVSPAKEGEQCVFLDNVVGRCENLLDCLGANGVARRNGNIVMCNKGSSTELVACCRRPHLVAAEMCAVWARYWLVETPDGNQTCISTQPLIKGGEEARLGEFPNMAAVGLGNLEENIEWVCGGSLITPSFVLTAAHCLASPHMWVGLGEHDLGSGGVGSLPRLERGMPGGLETANVNVQLRSFVEIKQRIKVAQRIPYPEYQKNYHDIALLRLEQQVVLTNRVLPACLPTNVSYHYTGESMFTIAGWGETAFAHPQKSRKLQKASISHIDSISCAHNFSSKSSVGILPLGITTDIICAGSPGKDSCRGDSGGPLMRKAELLSNAGPCQPQMVVGVVSFGPPCENLGAYTRVSSYIDWITSIVAPKLLPAPLKF